MTKLSIVIPAYDELPNLRRLLPRIRAVLDASPVSLGEVLVVVRTHADPDGDAEIRDLGAVPVRRTPGDSFGDAIRTGLAAVPVDRDLVLTMDADGSHDPDRIPLMLAHAEGAHVVVASRYVAGGRSDNSAPLKAMSRALNRAYSLVLGIDCRDVSTNFKLYRREDVERVRLSCAAFDIVEELLIQVARLHPDDFRIVEVPDHFRERELGETKRQLGPFIAAYLATLVRLRWQGDRRRRG